MLGLALLICFAPFSVSAACAAIWGSAKLAAAMPLLISMRRRLSLTPSLGPDCCGGVAMRPLLLQRQHWMTHRPAVARRLGVQRPRHAGGELARGQGLSH